MTNTPVTLSTGPPPTVAMDFEALRSEALAVLGQLTGNQWTDHNSHDPGITILEQLCFAITELAYRANVPIADLIASAGDPSWPPPSTALLGGDPVTDDDMAALLEEEGATALRITPLEISVPALWFHETDVGSGRGDLLGSPPPDDPLADPIGLLGLRQVRLQPAALLPVARYRLDGVRLLGEELVVESLAPFVVSVAAELEVGPVDDPEALLSLVFDCLQATITPSPRQAMAEIRCSDLLHALLDLPAVRAVRTLRLSASRSSEPEEGEVWLLPIPVEHVAVLDRASRIRLFRDGLPLRPSALPANPGSATAALSRTALTPSTLTPSSLTSSALTPASLATAPAPAPGRRRDLTRFHSLRRQLPAAYGVGPAGLGMGVSAERRALAQQLEAYLLIFDQLLANGLAQLALAPRLLSPALPPPGEAEQSYGSLPLSDPPLALTALLDPPGGDYGAWLRQVVEPADPLQRCLRFQAHLLARFGEELLPADATPETLLAARRAFLADIARMGGARGSGINLLDPEGASGGFAERLRRKLGLPVAFPQGSTTPPFLLIEHILLRPRPEDAVQLIDEGDGALPFLSGVTSADPWSLQVSLVMNQALVPAYTAEDPDAADNFERRVAGVFAAELPVRLHARLLWFGDGGTPSEEPGLWTDTVEAWSRFQRLFAEDRARPALSSSAETLARLAFRDARDRLLELLALGRPWPLRDIPLPEELVVTQGLAAAISLPFSQRGVRYELWEKDGNAPLAQGREGNGALLTLSTPPIQNDFTVRVRAVKVETTAVPRATWLRGEVRVIEGIDTTLVPAFRDLPPLAPEASAVVSARLCSYGVAVIVDIPDSQNGITYDLVDRVDRDQGVTGQRRQSSTSVAGNGGTVSLTYPFAAEDRDLQVRASRTVSTAMGEQVALLTTPLLLRVRADPAIPVALDAPVAPFAAEGALRVGTTLTKAQKGVTYAIWSQRIADEAFITDPFQPPPAAGVPALVVVDGGRTIRVARPAPSSEATALAAAGFTPLDTPREGNANLLAFAPGPVRVDATLVVLATKTHRLDPLDGPTPLLARSVVQLEGAVAQLVRPDPGARLILVRWQQDDKSGLWRVFGGEAGVFYRFVKDGSVLAEEEAYGHQRDDQPPFALKGLERLRIQLNLAIAADPLPDAPVPRDTSPIPLLTLALSAADLPAKLSVQARRALSGLTADLDVPPLLVRVEPSIVPKGQAAKVVLTSRPQETYALEWRRDAMGAPLEGDGGDLALPTDPLEATTTLELVITPADGDPWRVPVPVPVKG